MSETTHERVDELLASAESSLESLPDSSDDGLSAALDDDGDAADLRDAAAEADDLLEGDSRGVLEAIGLRELPDGSEAGSIPEAIAKGDEEQVSELHALVKLAQLSDRWDESEDGGGESVLEDGVIELRETLAERSGESESGGGSESAPDEDDQTDEASAESVDDAESDTDTDEEDGGSIEDQLQSAFDDALGGFGDEVREARDQFQQLLDEDSGDADQAADETDTAEADAADEDAPVESAGEDATDEDARDEETDDERADTDDGRADTGGSRGGTSSRGSTMHSTMAPPPADRPDMGRAGRLSTMPDRRGRPHR